MLRVILDVNVLVSGLLWDGPPATTYDLVVQNHALLISGTLLAELEHTLSRSRFASRIARRGTSVAALTADVRRAGEFVEVAAAAETLRIRDEADRYLLETAIGGEADYLVTGDRDLLAVRGELDMSIVTPAEFLAPVNS